MKDPLPMRLRRVVHSVWHPSFLSTARLLWKLDDPSCTLRIDELEELAALMPAPEHHTVTPRPGRSKSCIPPLVFQTWKSKAHIPVHYKYWRETFREKNPSYEIVLWDDDDNRRFIAAEYEWFLDIYNAFPREIFRADAVRPFFLFHYGGIYADMDTECLRSLDGLRQRGDVLLCRMGGDARFDHSLPNAIMASKPGQIFWLYVIASMVEAASRAAGKAPHPGPEYVTGPVLLGQAYKRFHSSSEREIRQYVHRIVKLLSVPQRERMTFGQPTILDPAEWYPLDWTNLLHKRLCNRLRQNKLALRTCTSAEQFPDSTLVTYWSHSW